MKTRVSFKYFVTDCSYLNSYVPISWSCMMPNFWGFFNHRSALFHIYLTNKLLKLCTYLMVMYNAKFLFFLNHRSALFHIYLTNKLLKMSHT